MVMVMAEQAEVLYTSNHVKAWFLPSFEAMCDRCRRTAIRRIRRAAKIEFFWILAYIRLL